MEINFVDMIETVFPYLIAAVIVWFFLIYKLIKILKLRHPDIYEQLDKPRFLREKGMLPLLKYLVLLKWRTSEDIGLKNLCRFMIVFIAAYMMVFLPLWFGMLFTAF